MNTVATAFRCGYVALVGRPNVGKSTLLNTLLGERLAAVSPKAQTTRRRFRGIRTDSESQIIFVDTPGIHVAPQGKKLNEYCVSEAIDTLADADVIVYMIDVSRSFAAHKADSDEAFLLEVLAKALRANPRPLIVLLNKVDMPAAPGAFIGQRELEEALKPLPVTSILPISARTGAGADEFVSRLQEFLPQGPALYPEDDLTDQNLRSIVGELVQEQLFLQLGEEVPYSCAVEVVRFQEPEETSGKRLYEIDVAIHVERDSQKPMLIGKGGAKIREIGSRARERVERLLDQKTVLRLFVKHTPHWSRDQEQLRRLGYTLPQR